MASEEGDIGALKRNVLHLLLKHPEGVRFGDFAGAFYRVHGYYPHISLYGYGSLKSLLADMKNVVVVEGDSQRAVLKLANGFHLDHWLEGENGLDSSEGEAQSLTDEEKVGGDAALAKVLASLVSLLKVYKAGLRIKRVQKFLLASYGINLKAFSIARGYKDILAFLEHQMPELNIRYEETTEKCVIKLTAVPCSPSPSLDSDFSACSLNSIPGAFTRKTSGSSSPIPSLATGFSASNSNAVPQKLVMKKPGLETPANGGNVEPEGTEAGRAHAIPKAALSPATRLEKARNRRPPRSRDTGRILEHASAHNAQLLQRQDKMMETMAAEDARDQINQAAFLRILERQCDMMERLVRLVERGAQGQPTHAGNPSPIISTAEIGGVIPPKRGKRLLMNRKLALDSMEGTSANPNGLEGEGSDGIPKKKVKVRVKSKVPNPS